MKNEEIIRETRKLADKHKYDSVLTFGINYHMAFTDIANHIEEQEQENDKLKAEIEQLKKNINKISVFENELYSEKQVAVDCEDAYMELAIDNQLNAVSRIKLMMKH